MKCNTSSAVIKENNSSTSLDKVPSYALKWMKAFALDGTGNSDLRLTKKCYEPDNTYKTKETTV